MKKMSENACCAHCKKRGELIGGFYECAKRGKVRPSDVCKKYEFDPFAPRERHRRDFDASTFDPLDCEI